MPSACTSIQVVHVAAEDLRPGTGERRGARIRTAEPDHVVASADQFLDKAVSMKPVAPVTNTRIVLTIAL